MLRASDIEAHLMNECVTTIVLATAFCLFSLIQVTLYPLKKAVMFPSSARNLPLRIRRPQLIVPFIQERMIVKLKGCPTIPPHCALSSHDIPLDFILSTFTAHPLRSLSIMDIKHTKRALAISLESDKEHLSRVIHGTMLPTYPFTPRHTSLPYTRLQASGHFAIIYPVYPPYTP
jgi:hypothetical protein